MPERRTDMAISDDRQWLIVRDKERYHRHDVHYYAVYEWSDYLMSYQWRNLVTNTGQRVEEALQEFLDGRE